MNKLLFPINNTRKKIFILFVLFFGFLSQSELNILFWNIPDFNQLTVTEGKLKITNVIVRTGTVYTLIIGDQKIPFNCGLPAVDRRDCISFNKLKDIQGKTGKVWWYRSKETKWDNSTRIYQLEINGNLKIIYKEQKEKYLLLKNSYLYPYTILFIISIIMFVLMQFANDPINLNRNEK